MDDRGQDGGRGEPPSNGFVVAITVLLVISIACVASILVIRGS